MKNIVKNLEIYTFKKKKKNGYNTPNPLSQAMQIGLIYQIVVYDESKFLIHKNMRSFLNAFSQKVQIGQKS